MKKRIIFIFVLLLVSYAFSKKKYATVDNTFSCIIQNESDFDITIDSVTVASRESLTHKFPLHTAALYDGWEVEYKIPLSDSVYYVLSEKKSLADNQKKLIIENPADCLDSSSYLVIKNTSKASVRIEKSLRGTVLPCYASGIVNLRKDLLKPLYTIASGGCAVVTLTTDEPLSVVNENNGKAKLVSMEFVRGFVYECEFTDETVVLHDARPIHLINEKLWHRDFPDSQVVRAVSPSAGKIYVMGTEILSDSRKNNYSSGFLQCLDRNGTELWSQSYAEKGKDTFLYDMAFLDEHTIAIVGQSILEEMRGLFLLYDSDGRLLKSATVAEAIGFEKIKKNVDGSFLIVGYSIEENPVEYALMNTFELKKSSDGNMLDSRSEFIQSVNSEVYGENGILYRAGESAEMEKPAACVERWGSDGTKTVLYMAKEPYSYITGMKINRKRGELLVCGSLGGRDEFGNYGKPFVRCLDEKSGKVVWEHILQTPRYEVAVGIASCSDYGFVLILANADDEGNLCAPCALVRTNAVGKTEL